MAKDMALHRPLLLLSVSVLGMASLAIVSMAISLERTPVTRTASARDVSTVLRYYDAVNELIATGDPQPLRSVLHADFTGRGTPETETDGYDSLVSYLSWLRAIAPDTRLVAGPVASDGEQVIAQVSVTTSTKSLPLGFSLSDPSLIWPAFEEFRVSLGQITERRIAGHLPPELNERYSAGSTAPVTDGAALETASFTFTGISRVTMSTSSMPAVFHVTAGNPVLSLAETSPDAAIRFSPALDPSQENRTAIPPGTTARAGPGDILVVLSDSKFSLLNVKKKEVASLVSVSAGLVSGVNPETPVISNSSGFGVSMVEHLRRPLENTGAGTRLSLGTVRISPGASLHVSPDTRLMAILDSPGELLLSESGTGCRDASATPSPVGPLDELPAGLNMLCPDAEHGGLLTNAGDAPISVWIVAVVTA